MRQTATTLGAFRNADVATTAIDASGILTITSAYTIAQANSGTSDAIDTITPSLNGISSDDSYFIMIEADAGDTITLNHGTGNLTLKGAANIELTGGQRALLFGSAANGFTDFAVSSTGSGSSTPNFGNTATKTIASGVVATGTDRNLVIAAETGTAGDLIEITGLTVGDKVLLRADTGDTITVKHNDAGATVKILIQDDNDFVLDEVHPLELILVATSQLVQVYDEVGAGGSVDAADVTYTPSVLADWDSAADPGDVDNALDQLAERTTDVEAYAASLVIGSTVQAYDADLDAWSGKTAPTGTVVGTTDSQTLTNKTLTTPTIASFANAAHSHADAAGGGQIDASVITYTPAVTTDWDGDADPGDVDNALDQLAERVDDLEGAGGGSGAYTSVAILRDEKSTGTNGGSCSATTWNNRNLNTEVYDPDAIVSIASNQFTPIAGDYEIVVTASVFKGTLHRLRLYNVTGAASVEEGLNTTANAADSTTSTATLSAKFTANGTDAYRIDHYTSAAQATNGLGVAASDGSNEVYLEIILRKLS